MVRLHHLAIREKLHHWSHRAVRCARWPMMKFFLSARGDQRQSFSMSPRWWKLKFSTRWPKLCTYFRDIFGSPAQGGASWAKWVSPLNSSMKTTTFKPTLYFYHRIPLTLNVTYIKSDFLESRKTSVIPGHVSWRNFLARRPNRRPIFIKDSGFVDLLSFEQAC